ncbi:MAG TPA: hypothetical protein VGR91_14810 [Stellaceae bacterium]|nr:hypothetical protein [Stellaceae bacterium]
MIALFLESAGIPYLANVADCLRQCGFDENEYLAQNADLRTAGHDASSALFHFLVYGLDEDRQGPFAPLPDGLSAVRSLEIPNAEYRQRLYRAIFFAQLRNPATADRLWNTFDAAFIDDLRAMGGIPYYVVGDSHADRYRCRAAFEGEWLAPLPLICTGGTAIGLARETSRTGYGARILQWAERAAGRPGGLTVPVFLKFGGLDAEFLWMSRRIEKGLYRFPVDEFCEFAEMSVAKYGGFLEALRDIAGARQLRVCSVFPSVLTQADWIAGFIKIFGRSPEYNRQVSEDLSKVSHFPSLRLRTKYRELYNTLLEQMCKSRNLVFIDDFSPLLGPDGVIDARYCGVSETKDFHIGYEASQESLVRIIRSNLRPDGIPRPSASAAS